jgi:hypothetical protein
MAPNLEAPSKKIKVSFYSPEKYHFDMVLHPTGCEAIIEQ